MLILKVKNIDLDLEGNTIVVNEDDLLGTPYYPNDRVSVEAKNGYFIGTLYSTKSMVNKGEVGINLKKSSISLSEGEKVRIKHAPKPKSIQYIRKKMNGLTLYPNEIHSIIDEIVSKKLTNIELTAFVVSTYINGMETKEIVEMTKRMAETGTKLQWENGPIVDVHSIGGVPGNKYALLTVPIVAAAGIIIPKTSSRAITSAAGTADVMEVLTNVNLSSEEIKRVVKTTNGCLVWGGAVNLAPADDIIINVERPLSIDPIPQLLSSVMAKKLATGIDYTVIDIPVGKEVKIKTEKEGNQLARKFIELGDIVGINVECVLSYGGQVIGNSVGPCLEAKEALEALINPENAPNSLIEKSVSLAGILLELGGAAPQGRGKVKAMNILKSKKALEKFYEIIVEQGGKEQKPEDIKLGKYSFNILSPKDGYVVDMSNKLITKVCKEAGAPRDKGAGVYLYKKVGQKVDKDEVLYTIYSNSKDMLDSAVNLARRTYPVRVEGMILKKISKF